MDYVALTVSILAISLTLLKAYYEDIPYWFKKNRIKKAEIIKKISFRSGFDMFSTLSVSKGALEEHKDYYTLTDSDGNLRLIYKSSVTILELYKNKE